MFRQVPMLSKGTRVPPQEVVPMSGHSAQILVGYQQKAMFRLLSDASTGTLYK